MPRCNEGNAFPYQYRHDVDDELVNCTLVKEGPNDFTSTHHPDVLACLLAEALGKGPDRFRDKLDPGGDGYRGSPTREDVVYVLRCEARTHLHTQVEGLATQNFGVD